MTVERPLPVEGQAPRITELWAWTAIDPMTDVEGIVAYRTRQGGGMPAVTSMRQIAELMGPVIREDLQSAQDPRPVLQLRRFVPAEEA